MKSPSFRTFSTVYKNLNCMKIFFLLVSFTYKNVPVGHNGNCSLRLSLSYSVKNIKSSPAPFLTR